MLGNANPWLQIRDGDARARGMLNRHYSRNYYSDGRRPVKTFGPGEHILLMTPDSAAVFGWLHNIIARDDGQEGVCCTLFRNERPEAYLSSALIIAAERFVVWGWPAEERLFTYIDPGKVQSSNPGYCFIKAGWRRAGHSKSGKLLLEKVEGFGVTAT